LQAQFAVHSELAILDSLEPVAAKLLPSEAVVAQLLTLDAIGPKLLTLDPVCPDLLAFDAVRAFGADLLPFNAMRAIGTNLLALDAVRPLDALGFFAPILEGRHARAALTALRVEALRPFSALRAESLRPLGARHGRALGPLDTLRLGGHLAAAAALDRGGSLAALAAMSAPFRTGRGCDRQRGDAGGEKHPGQHEISPFERQNGRSDAPFQRLAGWTRSFSALA
jgi:hypothetical protein